MKRATSEMPSESSPDDAMYTPKKAGGFLLPSLSPSSPAGHFVVVLEGVGEESTSVLPLEDRQIDTKSITSIKWSAFKHPSVFILLVCNKNFKILVAG